MNYPENEKSERINLLKESIEETMQAIYVHVFWNTSKDELSAVLYEVTIRYESNANLISKSVL